MADLQTLQNAFMKAHTAGDTASAQVLATEIKRQMAGGTQAPQGQAVQGNADRASASGQMMDTAFGGLSQKLNAGGIGLIQGGIVDPIMGRGFNVGNRYDEILNQQRDDQSAYNAQNPKTALAAKIGGVGLGIASLPGVGSGFTGALKTGALYGGLSGLIDDSSTVQGHLGNALLGSGEGAALGGLLHGAVQSLPAVTSAIAAPLKGYLNPEGMANSVLEKAVRKSGGSIQDIQNAIQKANLEGNKGFVTADAMGKKGQELLSTIVRSPNDAQQSIAETLLNRQAGQSGRVGGFVKEGLGANQTADQATTALTKARGTVADTNYSAARSGAQPVDLTDTINTIDNIVGPKAKFNVGISPDSTESGLLRIRNQLAAGNQKGQTTRSDFQNILSQKGDLKDTIDALYAAGKSNQANALKQVYNKLDEALSNASPQYRNANDTFSQMSRPIDAVSIGGQASRPSMRAADNIPAYQKLDPASQAAHNVGYADPLLARIETSPPGVNTVRPLLSDKYSQELGAFAKNPSLLGRQLNRENTMNATMQRALGGSKTADNLLNEGEMSQISPSELLGAARGGITGLASLIFSKGANLVTGKNAAVRSLLGERLMSQDPAAFIAALEKARTKSAGRRDNFLKSTIPMTGLLGYSANRAFSQK